MKRITFFIALILIMVGCKPKGWSVSDRNQFISSCTNGATATMGQDKAKAYCSCMEQKLEVKYPDPNDKNLANQTSQSPEMMAMAQGCLGNGNINNNNMNNNNGNNNNNNIAGGWTRQDEDKWMTACATNPNDREVCSCMLQKLEKKYTTYDEMNRMGTQEEGRQLAMDCKNRMNGNGGNNNNLNNNNNNMGGGWTNEDEQKFMNSCVQNAMNAGANQQMSNTHCQCTLKKIENKYTSYNDANQKMTKEEVSAIEQECVNSGN